jgi:hypothetical protein
MGIVDVAVSYDPLHAALPSRVELVLQLCGATFEAFDAIVEGLEKAFEIISRIAIIEAMSFSWDLHL